MASLDDAATSLRDALHSTLGPAGANPIPRGFTQVLGSFLRAAAAGEKAARAIDALESAGLAGPADLADADRAEVLDILKEGGAPSTPAAVATLQKLAGWYRDRFGDADIDEEEATQLSIEALRDELRAIRGIGAATTESILLEGLGRPAYPLDRTTYRILVRHGWIDPTTEFDEARAVMEWLGEHDAAELALWSEWMGQLGRKFCKVAAPRCDSCPLLPFLPGRGPVDPGE
jgi:endonuclease-3 related protein